MMDAPSIDDYLAPSDEWLEDRSGVSRGVREYLVRARAYLEQLHRSGGAGQQVNEARSDLMDGLVRRLFELAEEVYFGGGGEGQARLCVAAVGGYARREMNIHSDVDLLFLYQDELTSHVAAVAECVQIWLWDASLAVSAATRTIDETVEFAQRDATVLTAVLVPRFLIGSGVLFHDFQRALRKQLLSDPGRIIAEQLEVQAGRHQRFGDSLYLLQPDLKEGAGALRDYHLAYWAMQISEPNARGREDFLHLGLLTEREMKQYTAALDFLWRTRNELHLLSGWKNDRLKFHTQEKIAEALGYGRIDEQGPELPVERFMSDYYRQARAIRNFSSLVIEQCERRVRRPRKRHVRRVEGGFRLADGKLEIPHARQLRENPVLLLLAFAVAQDHDAELTRKAQRLIRAHLSLIDEPFRRLPEARAAFLRILGSERRVTRSLTAMNEVGLLAAFLPEWQHILFRWQHVMYHTYTVDVHSIFLVRELRRLWLGRYEEELPELTELMRTVDDRVVLYLGCLLHDIGKGFGQEHSKKGAERCQPCLERLGLSPESQERVIFLVRYHLEMARLAQRRNLTDPKLIFEFGRLVGDRTNLRDLYLLTFADLRASSSIAWTEWKGRLLQELFGRTSELLETGADDPRAVVELIEKRVEARREASTVELRRLGIDEAEIAAYFEMMPRRYFTAHTPKQIARHAQVVLALETDRTVSTAIREVRDAFSELIVCTKDVSYLFANVTGVLTAHDINILGAHVYTTRTGLALELYRVDTPPGGEAERRIAWEEFEQSLEAVLSGELEVARLLERKRRRVGVAAAPLRRPPKVSITNEESDLYTIVDVEANDRLGLLHDLTRTIARHGYEVYISKAGTALDQVADSFYLKDREGKKLRDVQAIERLREDLLAAARLGEQDGGG